MRVGERGLEYRARPVKLYGWRIKVQIRRARLGMRVIYKNWVSSSSSEPSLPLSSGTGNGRLWYLVLTKRIAASGNERRRAYNSVAFCKLSKISGLWQYYYDIGQSLSLVYIRLQVSRKLFPQNILWKMASICRPWPSLKCSQSARYFYSGKQLKIHPPQKRLIGSECSSLFCVVL